MYVFEGKPCLFKPTLSEVSQKYLNTNSLLFWAKYNFSSVKKSFW